MTNLSMNDGLNDAQNSENTPTIKWVKRLEAFATPSTSRSFFELGLTLVLFVAFWLSAAFLIGANSWQTTALAILSIIAGGFMIVRLFIVQHDCGHGSFFTDKNMNNWVGRALGILTFTPYDVWKHDHALHHASHGNLDKRGFGDIDTLTVTEYRARSFWGRMQYRAYRHPAILFLVGPIYMFLLRHRIPATAMTKGASPWVSTQVTNLGIAILCIAMIMVFGWKVLVFVHLPIVIIGAMIGVWLFYVQHQFDPTFWARADEWEREKAALDGSSFYDLPQPLMWLTGNIGIHHVHHVASRIPFYRLPDVIKAHPEFVDTETRLTLWGSIKCVRLTLWDEAQKRMISFRDLQTA